MDCTHITRHTVQPSPPSPPHLVTLSNNDQIMPPYYTGFLYFFNAPSSPSQVCPESLQRSLARALAAFPPVAGRLKARSLGAGLDVDCNNQGAIFVEAQATATLQDLRSASGNRDSHGEGAFQPSPLWPSLAPFQLTPLWTPPYTSDPELAEKPLLFTQVTRLGCGGVVLAVLLHHFVADGAAQAHFVSSWAELARGEEISAHPHLDRTCMQARTPPCPSFQHIEYIVHKQVPQGPATAEPATAESLPPMTSKIFDFLPQDILCLKDTANAEFGRDVFTGFQALAGHIWKHVTKARGIEPSRDIKLGWAVDGRKRFTPPLPLHYFGNVNFYGCTEANAGEVMGKAGHEVACSSIQAATQRMTDEYLHSALDWIQEQQGGAEAVMASFTGPGDWAITSWARFASYAVDFGWGAPVWFAPPAFAFSGLAILLPHPLGHGAVNVLLGLPLPHMAALLAPALFHPVRLP